MNPAPTALACLKFALPVFLLLVAIPTEGRATASEVFRTRDLSTDPVDLSAIERFWPIYHALRADRDPTEAEWEALFSTPAWETLGGFRRSQARQRYVLAFRPSSEADFAAAVDEGGYDATVLRHLRSVIDRESDLRAFQDRLQAGTAGWDVPAAVGLAAEYLPADARSGPVPGIAAVFYAPDGYADGRVVADLLYTMEVGSRATLFLAHELHHVYQARLIRPFTRPADGSSDPVLLEALFQLQREGVANLVGERETLRAEDTPADSARVMAFRDEVARSPEVLAQVSERLERMAGAEASSALALAREIRWQVLPGSGHPTGLFMARTIEDALGRSALIATLSTPFDFVRAYNRAARMAGLAPLGLGAMAELDALESRLFP
jgi:hypothetical protein